VVSQALRNPPASTCRLISDEALAFPPLWPGSITTTNPAEVEDSAEPAIPADVVSGGSGSDGAAAVVAGAIVVGSTVDGTADDVVMLDDAVAVDVGGDGTFRTVDGAAARGSSPHPTTTTTETRPSTRSNAPAGRRMRTTPRH